VRLASLQQLQETDSKAVIVRMSGITKRFDGVIANDNIDFELRSGEIHALLGENGAGKTTLMNILYGLYSADSGQIFVDGKLVNIRSPKDAIGYGIGMVHQSFQLVSTATVAENIILGQRTDKPLLLDLNVASSKIEKLSKTYGLSVDPRAKIEQLSMGERQRVEIVKALYREARILILDEPTSVLTPQEGDELFKLIHSMAEQGKTIVLITHKLPEVMAVCSKVTILRHGKVVANLVTELTTPTECAEFMVGREISLEEIIEQPKLKEKSILELKNISALNDNGLLGVRELSLTLHEGEILGIAGVAGNGQKELAEVIAGLRRSMGGEVLSQGEKVTNKSPAQMIAHGIRYIPEDRLESGVIPDFTIAENLVLERRQQPPFSKNGLLNSEAIEENAIALVKEYDIVASSPDVPARTLSGGNLQKLILAKILSGKPRVIIASNPTAGLDVGASLFIRNRLRHEAESGVGILLISGDLSELLSLCHRIAVMYEGKITGIVAGTAASTHEIGLLMGGVSKQA
jgi:general nucleoside transport system ATP-binding protein